MVTDKFGQKAAPVKTGCKYSEGMMRRANHISDILYEYITQMIGTGALDIYVGVSRVRVLPDMSHVNIYWEASGNLQRDNEIQVQLEQKSATLRYLLASAHAFSNIPKVMFVKDFTACRQKQLDKIFKILDVGSGDEPKKNPNDPQLTQNSNKQSNLDTLTNIKTETEVDSSGGEICNAATFRQDLYGLQHNALMKKVVDSKVTSLQRPVIESSGIATNEFSFADKGLALKMKEYFKSNLKKERRLRRLGDDSFQDNEFDLPLQKFDMDEDANSEVDKTLDKWLNYDKD